MRKHLFCLRFYSVLRLHLHPTFPRGGPSALLPKPHKLRSVRGQQKLPDNTDWSWKKENNDCVFQRLEEEKKTPWQCEHLREGKKTAKIVVKYKKQEILALTRFYKKSSENPFLPPGKSSTILKHYLDVPSCKVLNSLSTYFSHLSNHCPQQFS